MTLYLKYRPKDFDELEGQTFIKQTLRQAIAQDKLVGAYLFCGPRGTGKTSTARIFAKAVNCLHPENGNPCGKCDICKSFDEEKLVDIIEIDAASYTWVDNVREIIERASFVPNVCTYKIYIIDEVHMLSKGAFNALLKILEEPPSHLKFILATTEIHKIPETILSRCQRYDFKSISPQDVRERLLFIAEKEGVKIDEESISFIVKQSQWWLRNAVSLFEQLIKNSEIIYQNVIESFGIPKTEVIETFYQKILQKDVSVVRDFEEISTNYQLNFFFKELLFYIRDQILESLQSPDLKNLIFILETLEESYVKSKNSFDPKTTFLVGVIKSLQGAEFFVVSEEKKSFPEPQKLTSVWVTSVSVKKELPKETTTIASLETIELSTEDLFDVFWEEHNTVLETPPSSVISQETHTPQPKTGNFSIEPFITSLKKLWSKWAVTMSLRSAQIDLIDGNKLQIIPKTSIARNQIAQADSVALMSQACSEMGLWDIEIIIK